MAHLLPLVLMPLLEPLDEDEDGAGAEEEDGAGAQD
jgi:hypothetical protein